MSGYFVSFKKAGDVISFSSSTPPCVPELEHPLCRAVPDQGAGRAEPGGGGDGGQVQDGGARGLRKKERRGEEKAGKDRYKNGKRENTALMALNLRVPSIKRSYSPALVNLYEIDFKKIRPDL